MLKCQCANCKQYFNIPENYSEKMIKCPECGAMNQPNSTDTKLQEFSIVHLPIDKLIGYFVCLVISKRKWVIPVAIVLAIGIVGVVYALCRANPEFVELRKLNTHASQLIYNNQPENALNVYNQILERLSHERPSKITREWTPRINGAKIMAVSACEMNLVRKCQTLVRQAEAFMKDGKVSEGEKILMQVSNDLEKSSWKGNPTEILITKVRTMIKEAEEKHMQ